MKTAASTETPQAVAPSPGVAAFREHEEIRRSEERAEKILQRGLVTKEEEGIYVTDWDQSWPYRGSSTELSLHPVEFRRSVTLLGRKTPYQLQEGDAWLVFQDNGVKHRVPQRRLRGDELAAAVPVEVLVLCARAEARAIDAKKLLASTAAETERRKRVVEQRRHELEEAEGEVEEAARIQASADRNRQAEETRFQAWVDGCGYSLEAIRAAAAALNS